MEDTNINTGRSMQSSNSTRGQSYPAKNKAESMVADSNANLLPQSIAKRDRKKSTLVTTQYNDIMTLDSLAKSNSMTP